MTHLSKTRQVNSGFQKQNFWLGQQLKQFEISWQNKLKGQKVPLAELQTALEEPPAAPLLHVC